MDSKLKALLNRSDLTLEQKVAIFNAFAEFALTAPKQRLIRSVTLAFLGGCVLGFAIVRS